LDRGNKTYPIAVVPARCDTARSGLLALPSAAGRPSLRFVSLSRFLLAVPPEPPLVLLSAFLSCFALLLRLLAFLLRLGRLRLFRGCGRCCCG
jgi:hypothetical protein